MLDIDFWQKRYETEETPWDLGKPSPHLQALMDEKPEWLKPGKVAVLGSGRGHDAALFAQNGFDVVGFDYSPGAVSRAKTLYGETLRFEQADIFDLPGSPWAGQFDYVLEHTCFCAILPKQREDYAQVTKALLKPNGFLLGVFWEHGNPDGPPFNTTLDDIQRFFNLDFEIIFSKEQPAAENREGTERLLLLRRRA